MMLPVLPGGTSGSPDRPVFVALASQPARR
jgi:hypothetical protein